MKLMRFLQEKYMTVNNDRLEIKGKIERLGMILVENSEKIAQICIDNEDITNLDEVLLLLLEKLDLKVKL